jgi:deazaflavin-dependent oxidoreductase (nitroreductase family)
MSDRTTPMLDHDRIRTALGRGGTIDVTTTGRRTGQARRLEIVYFNFDGRIWITGLPGRRGWYANLLADPRLTFHLKRGLHADLPAQARPITDEPTRRAILERVTRAWRREDQLEAFVARAPLIEVMFDDPTLLAA